MADIVRGCEHGATETISYVREKHLYRDASAEAMMLKWHALNYIRTQPLFSEASFSHFSLCGIGFQWKKYPIRFWKSTESDLPVLRRPSSENMRKFYDQATQPPLLPTKRGLTGTLNLAVLYWLENNGTIRLWLVCPKSFDETAGTTNFNWWIAIQSPAFSQEAPTTVSQSDELAIEPKQIQTEKEG